jgi:CHAD domain-containing protein
MKELSRHEADARGARRILCDQIDQASAELARERVSDEQIHAARKSLKKARATLRLMKEAMPRTAYRRENAALRDAARPLSAARDARVLLDTLDRLEKLYGDPARQSIPAAFRLELTREQASARRAALAPRDSSSESTHSSSLGDARRRIARWRVDAHGWQEIGEGLKRVYSNGRKAMKQARITPLPDCLHEWRKQTKYLWHQLQLLQPMCPGPVGELADQCHNLSDYLGDDHDLAVLREKVVAHSRNFSGPGGSGALLALIDRCQNQLREKAFLAGGRIYDEKPAAFATRFSQYWQRWQKEKTAKRA